MTYLQTNRLVLRNLNKCDLSALMRIRNDALCAKYQRWDDTTEETISAMIERHAADIFPSLNDVQRYAISLPCGSFIGDVTVFYTQEDNCFTLGITVDPNHQREGYAFEMLQQVVLSLKQKYPTTELVALIHPDNQASKALFRKLGFTFECYAKSIDSDVFTL